MAQATSRFDVRLLGPVEVWQDGEQLPLGGGRQRALLAVLALQPGEVVSSDRLIDELWGEHPPETAATALHGLVSQVRKAVEIERSDPEVLVTRPPGYALDLDTQSIDAFRFERLVREGRERLSAGDARSARDSLDEALALWRGDALAGVADLPFARTEARRLDEVRLAARADRVDAELALGNAASVVPSLEQAIAGEPLAERPRAQLIRALYASGRQADALAAYRDARRVLDEELGVEPGPELRELERRILEQDPELADLPAGELTAPAKRHRGLVIAIAAAMLALAGGVGAWLALRDDAEQPIRGLPNTLAEIDPESGRVVDETPVGERPTQVRFGEGSLWVTSAESQTLSRIDESGDVIATIGVGPAIDLAIGEGAVWVANGSSGTVSQVDPVANSVVRTIDLRGSHPLLAQPVQSIAVGGGSVWVGSGDRFVVQIEPRTGRVERRIDVGGTPEAMTFGFGALWVGVGGDLVRLNPRDLSLERERLRYGTPSLTTGDGLVWTFGADVTGFAPDTLSPRGSVSPALGWLYDGAVGDGVVWAANLDGNLLRLDTEAQRPPQETPLVGQPLSVATGFGRVWVAVAPEGTIS